MGQTLRLHSFGIIKSEYIIYYLLIAMNFRQLIGDIGLLLKNVYTTYISVIEYGIDLFLNWSPTGLIISSLSVTSVSKIHCLWILDNTFIIPLFNNYEVKTNLKEISIDCMCIHSSVTNIMQVIHIYNLLISRHLLVLFFCTNLFC